MPLELHGVYVNFYTYKVEVGEQCFDMDNVFTFRCLTLIIDSQIGMN